MFVRFYVPASLCIVSKESLPCKDKWYGSCVSRAELPIDKYLFIPDCEVAIVGLAAESETSPIARDLLLVQEVSSLLLGFAVLDDRVRTDFKVGQTLGFAVQAGYLFRDE